VSMELIAIFSSRMEWGPKARTSRRQMTDFFQCPKIQSSNICASLRGCSIFGATGRSRSKRVAITVVLSRWHDGVGWFDGCVDYEWWFVLSYPNHHGHAVLFGCGLWSVGGESVESFDCVDDVAVVGFGIAHYSVQDFRRGDDVFLGP